MRANGKLTVLLFVFQARSILGEDELSTAAMGDDTSLVTYFLNRERFDVNGGCEDGAPSGPNTPLHWSVININANMVKTLLAAGANVNCKNEKGATVLQTAIEVSSLARHYYYDYAVDIIRRLLVEAECDLRAVDLDNQTVIHYVVNNMIVSPAEGNADILETMVWRGAYGKDMKNEEGLTPLAQIAQDNVNFRNEQRYMCNYLLEMGFECDFHELSAIDAERFLRMYWRPCYDVFRRSGRSNFDDVVVALAEAWMDARVMEESEWRIYLLKDLVNSFEKQQIHSLYIIFRKLYRRNVRGIIYENYENIYMTYIMMEPFLSDVLDANDAVKEAQFHLRRFVLARVSWNLSLAAYILREQDMQDVVRQGLEILRNDLKSKEIYYDLPVPTR